MKVFIMLLGLGIPMTTAQAKAQNPIEVQADIDKIFIPQGFDDNDNVEIVLHGNFPNTCYQVGNTEAKVDVQAKVIHVTATSMKYPGRNCLQTVTPFIQTAKLGLIPEGNYQVVYTAKDSVRSTLEVMRRKTESPDDYLYASVDNAFIDVNYETGKQALKLQGHFPYFFIGCMVMKDVRVSRSPNDVLLVQPIGEIVDDAVCDTQPSDRSFEYTSGLAEPFKGEGLLHVRTLNGTSLNRYIDIK